MNEEMWSYPLVGKFHLFDGSYFYMYNYVLLFLGCTSHFLHSGLFYTGFHLYNVNKNITKFPVTFFIVTYIYNHH